MRCRLWVDSARPEQVGLARRLVRTVAGHVGLSSKRADDIVLAVSEALTNAVRAHGRIGSPDPILVTFGTSDGAFEVTVEDRGEGFDPLHGHAPLWAEDSLEENGRGIPLMWALADEAAVRSADSTVIELRFHLERALSRRVPITESQAAALPGRAMALTGNGAGHAAVGGAELAANGASGNGTGSEDGTWA